MPEKFERKKFVFVQFLAPRKEESPRKWLGEGAKGHLNRGSEKPLLHMVQETFGRPLHLGSTRPFASSLTTFGDFPVYSPSPRRSGVQTLVWSFPMEPLNEISSGVHGRRSGK